MGCSNWDGRRSRCHGCLVPGGDWLRFPHDQIQQHRAVGNTTFNVTFNSAGASSDASLGGGVAIAGDNLPVVVGSILHARLPKLRRPHPKAECHDGRGDSGTCTFGAATTPSGRRYGPDAIPVVAGYQCTATMLLPVCRNNCCSTRTATASTRVLTINGGQALTDGLTLTFNSVTAAGNTTFQTSNTGFPNLSPRPAGRPYASWRQVLPCRYDCDNYGEHNGLPELHQSQPHRHGDQLPDYRLSGTTWTNITTTRDTTANWLCGAGTLETAYTPSPSISRDSLSRRP